MGIYKMENDDKIINKYYRENKWDLEHLLRIL